MNQPLVTCVMLTCDRPAMAARAVRCFRAQTYEHKRLFVLDTGDGDRPTKEAQIDWMKLPASGLSIGRLRNIANDMTRGEIIAHWDDDDCSHSARLAEQIELLQASQADAVGYREMLFAKDGEAWFYRMPVGISIALGTSLCYWRKTWESKHFPDQKIGEDLIWQSGLKVKTASGLTDAGKLRPRMIATIHGQNSSSRIVPGSPEWHRVPEWDFIADFIAKELLNA